MTIKELESISWKQRPEADLPNPCALPSWSAPKSLELFLGLGHLALVLALGQLKTPCQPALAWAALVGTLQNTAQAQGRPRVPFMVPHKGNKACDVCHSLLSLDTEHRQDVPPPPHLPWQPEGEHTNALPDNGAEELLQK